MNVEKINQLLEKLIDEVTEIDIVQRYEQLSDWEKILYNLYYADGTDSVGIGDYEKRDVIDAMVRRGLLKWVKGGTSPFHDYYTWTARGKREAVRIVKQVEK